MDSTQFTSIAFFQKKKDITLYRAADEAHHYILKSIITKDAAVRQAFCDEFETLSHLRHPSIPVYYWLKENVMLPGQETGALTLCMEDCSCPGSLRAAFHGRPLRGHDQNCGHPRLPAGKWRSVYRLKSLQSDLFSDGRRSRAAVRFTSTIENTGSICALPPLRRQGRTTASRS